jgi:hypothetical protein
LLKFLRPGDRHENACRYSRFSTKEKGEFLEMAIYALCTVSKGLFETEFIVTIHSSSAYVDSINVKVSHPPAKGDEVEGKVLAYLIEEKNGQALIEIPGEPVVGGLRTWVPKTELASAVDIK